MLWKVLKESNLYSISEFGDIKNNKTGRIKSQRLHPKGYKLVTLCINGKDETFRVHRLVASNFLPEPSQKLIDWAKTTKRKVVLVNHKDGNKENNHYNNLEWCDSSYNVKHAYDNGLSKQQAKGVNSVYSKISQSDLDYFIKNYKRGDPIYWAGAMAKRFNVNRATISKYIKRYL